MFERPIFVISAPSGAGKNSLINVLLQKEPRLSHSISSTTRKRRETEIDGVNYYFLDRTEFEKRVTENQFIEYARVLENFWMQGLDDFARPTAYVDWFEIEGPIYDSWPPASHQQLLGRLSDGGDLSTEDEVKLVREVLVSFMRRAFRRPIEAAEVDDKLAIYRGAREQALAANEAI